MPVVAGCLVFSTGKTVATVYIHSHAFIRNQLLLGISFVTTNGTAVKNKDT